MIRVGVIGASGLAGGELLRLIDLHPSLELTFIGGSSNVGRTPSQLHPGLRKDFGLRVEEVTADIANRCDVVLLATPPQAAVESARLLVDRIETVIDLSGAFRIRSAQLHERWYPDVERPAELLDRAVYGVPELIGDRMKDATFISLPGCYATAISLSLAPLLSDDSITVADVVIDGKSGSSGGGMTLRTSDLHPLRSGAITPYAPGGHRHAGEVLDFFGRERPGRLPSLSMSAYGVSNVRGLLTSAYVSLAETPTLKDLAKTYVQFYRDAPFVRYRRAGETILPVPDPHLVTGSNFCDISVFSRDQPGRFVILGALDNLVKGAAGQAIQAVNARFDRPATEGLDMHPVMPV